MGKFRTAAAFGCTLFIAACQTDEERNCPDTTGAKIGAFVMSQQFVKQKLRDPKSAEFPSYSDSSVSVTWVSTCKFRVNAQVRATNAFGGYLVTPYAITVEYLPREDAFRASDFSMK